jgi:iron complex transport system ATP-binding protein
MKIGATNVRWSVGGVPILRDVSLTVSPGECVGVLGPNGSGKSSLLRCFYRILRPQVGLISLDGEDVWALTTRTVAQRAAVVLQEDMTDFDLTVAEIVAMGRIAHKGTFERDTVVDRRIVVEALARVGMAALADRDVRTLSGGERQRTLLARALAQQAKCLILDEPTNHLDIRAQMDTLALVRSLGITTLAALHDLNLAAHYCDLLYVLQEGAVAARGSPAEVLTPALIYAVYGVQAEVHIHPRTGKPTVTFTFENRTCENQDHT